MVRGIGELRCLVDRGYAEQSMGSSAEHGSEEDEEVVGEAKEMEEGVIYGARGLWFSSSPSD